MDDEVKVLDGLRRMLRVLRHEWHMEFAESGPVALQRLEESPFDVVVSDIRMPGMDGAMLLHEIRLRFPATVRIILSGQCDRSTVLKTLGVAHQFLTKPCDSEILRTTVARACLLRDRLADDWHKCMVSRVQSVPCMPSAYVAITEELAAPVPSFERTCELIAADVGLTAKFQQWISTSFLGTPQRCSNPKSAVHLFDMDTIRTVFSSPELVRPFDATSVLTEPLYALTRHSLTVAEAAHAIASLETNDPGLLDDVYLAGLLHDVGVFLLADYAPEEYLAMLNRAKTHESCLWEAERECLRVTHADIGGYLGALWGLSDTIVDTIAWHHEPRNCHAMGFVPLAAVHVADCIARQGGGGDSLLLSPIDDDFLRQLGLWERLPAWKKACAAALYTGEIA